MPEEEATAAANPRAGVVVDDVFGVEAGEAEASEHLRRGAVLTSGRHRCCDSCDGAAACIRPLPRTRLADAVHLGARSTA
jgi:hypothetical protein